MVLVQGGPRVAKGGRDEALRPMAIRDGLQRLMRGGPC